MCKFPSTIYIERGPRWDAQQVRCNTCWMCRERKISDYVGRSLCEAAYSDWTLAITLTYRDRTDLADKIITPAHFQEFIRSLRMRGHKVRYICSAETGSLYGRAHFHCVLFGKGKPLGINKAHQPFCKLPVNVRTWHDAWPHGHMFVEDDINSRSLSYLLKYNFKDFGDDQKQSWFTLSKKPPLGSEHFRKLAKEYSDWGVLPASWEYIPPLDKGERRYMVSGATRRDFIYNILENWCSKDIQPKHLNEWVRDTFDKTFRAAHHSELWRLSLDGDPEYIETQFQALKDDIAAKRNRAVEPNRTPYWQPHLETLAVYIARVSE